MLWKFSFATGSTLDTLLSRETPPSVEELLDDQDILSECKAQNNKLVTYLSREDSVKSLLSWVTSGLDDLDTQAEEAEDLAYSQALKSTEAYPPFKAGNPSSGVGPVMPSAGSLDSTAEEDDGKSSLDDTHPGLGIGLGQGLGSQEADEAGEVQRARYPQIATEILTSDLWTIPETVMNHQEALLRPFWDEVVPPMDRKEAARSQRARRERERAHLTFWSDEDEERERKREVVRGMWMRVNASLLQKRTTEMVRFIQSIPNIIERMVEHIESPAIQDMLARIIQTEEAGVSDVMNWLGQQRLIPRLLERLSPKYQPSMHAIVTDLLKGIVSVSAPNSSFNPQGGNAMNQQGGLQSSGNRDNRLVRELTDQESIKTLLGYILENGELTDSLWKGLDGETPGNHRSDPFVIHPLPSVASVTSSLCCVSNVIVEVIRRNNSDLAEPYLFNTMRNRLMTLQSEQMSLAPDEVVSAESEDASRTKMEGALPELADKLAIVHLGNLVAAISENFEQIHKLLANPRSQTRVAAPGNSKPLTMERYRVIELYAELLHSSNMATLNRVPGAGPDYSADGALTGGLDGLDKLGQALQTADTGDDDDDDDELKEDTPEAQVTQARELPVSSGSTDYSLTESDDVPLSDDEADNAASPATPVAPSTATLDATVPPPASDADAERLRNVMRIESEKVNPSEAASHAAVAATTAAPSLASDPAAEPVKIDDEPLPTGERLKQQFINFSVLPTLLDLFFEHANNNFLHHLVYDILQQILNGQLGRGYNRELVIDLFNRAKLVDRVLDAQRLNDRLVNSDPRKPRLSYMGHISLIAEELVKFFARCPTDLADLIEPSFTQSEWDSFVDGSLRETRARDSQPLAGGKPMPGLGSAMTTASERSDSESDDDDDGVAATIGEPLSRTVAKHSLDSYHDSGADEDGGMEQFWRPSNARSAAIDSSDDDDDDADWLRPAASSSRERRGSDDEDDFGAFQSTGKDLDDDDAWGSFTSVNAADSSENPFGDDAFAPSNDAASAYSNTEPLTPRDWAEAFDREFESAEPSTTSWADSSADVPAIVMPTPDETDADAPSWSFRGSDDQGEDLPPAAGNTLERQVQGLNITGGRRRSSSVTGPGGRRGSAPREEVLDEMATTSTADHPLGPGVSQDTKVDADGMLERTMPDGTVVRVPEDDVAVGIEDAMGRRVDEVDEVDGDEGKA